VGDRRPNRQTPSREQQDSGHKHPKTGTNGEHIHTQTFVTATSIGIARLEILALELSLVPLALELSLVPLALELSLVPLALELSLVPLALELSLVPLALELSLVPLALELSLVPLGGRFPHRIF
jgi:hypothetical protein